MNSPDIGSEPVSNSFFDELMIHQSRGNQVSDCSVSDKYLLRMT